jgi:hypothetical protein
MELLLKRNEKRETFGTVYELFAKLELKPEELERIRKAKPDKTYVWVPDEKALLREGLKSRIQGAIAAIFAGAVAVFVGLNFWGSTGFWLWLITPLLFFPFSKLLYNSLRQGITVGDIITGRTIRCKSIDELYEKEQSIKEKIQNYCQYLEEMSSLGSEQRIDLSRG